MEEDERKMMRLDIQLFGGRGASSSNIYNNILSIEKDRIGQTSEKLTILSKNGKVLKELDGGENYVDARKYRDIMKDAIVTHNHPTDDNFSSGDIKEFLESDLYELRASTSKEVYSIQKNKLKNTSSLLQGYEEANSKSWNYANTELQNKIKNNTLGYKPAEHPARYNLERQRLRAEYKHKWLKDNQKKYGYIYKKIGY